MALTDRQMQKVEEQAEDFSEELRQSYEDEGYRAALVIAIRVLQDALTNHENGED